MGIILDLIVLTIITACVFSSAKYGFVRTIIEIVGYILAVILISTMEFSGSLSIIYKSLTFVIMIVAVKIAAIFINKLFSFSIAGKINKLLGGILGIPKGLLLSVAFCLLVLLITTFSKDGFFIFSRSAIKESMIFEVIASLF